MPVDITVSERPLNPYFTSDERKALRAFADEIAQETVDYIAANPSVLSLSLDELSDVNAPSPVQADKLRWDSSTSRWVAAEASESIIVACSDETTDLTTGTAKVTFRVPYAFTLTSVRASVTTAPTGANLVVDINQDSGSGSASILSTKLSIDAGEKTSTTATTPPVISDTTLSDDAEITIDIDQIGSTIAGTGLKVTLIGYPT